MDSIIQINKIKKILRGDGSGRGSGDGSGSGSGDGSGSGYGSGYGSGRGSGSGDGSGRGSGSGYGSGSGSGYGSGDGSGDGDGSGSGDGDGSGDGSGRGYGETWILDNKKCYIANIDNISTALYSVKIKDNIAIMRGFIIDGYRLQPTFVCLQNGKSAHGSTLAESMQDLQDKILSSLNFEEIVIDLKSKYNLTDKIIARELMSIHRAVTGSCRQGCLSWAKENNIDLEHDKFTLIEFINLTKNAYGSESIKKLSDALI